MFTAVTWNWRIQKYNWHFSNKPNRNRINTVKKYQIFDNIPLISFELFQYCRNWGTENQISDVMFVKIKKINCTIFIVLINMKKWKSNAFDENLVHGDEYESFIAVVEWYLLILEKWKIFCDSQITHLSLWKCYDEQN